MKLYKFLAHVVYKNGNTEDYMWLESTEDAIKKASNYKKASEVKEVILYRIDKTMNFIGERD